MVKEGLQLLNGQGKPRSNVFASGDTKYPVATGAYLNLSTLIAFAGNLIPLAGVLYWGWDPFQLLMLYWMETVIVAGFALARITTVPKELLGTIKINGMVRPATHRHMIELFGGLAATFISVHFLFLWLLFSGDWTKTVRGPISFVQAFVIDSGAWAPLLFAFLAGAVAFLTSPTRPQFARDLQARFMRTSVAEETPKLDEATHGVGAAVGGMLGRIAIMQVAVIVGAMMAKTYGSMAPLLIVIGIKTLFDFRSQPISGVKVDFSIKTRGRTNKQSIRLPD